MSYASSFYFTLPEIILSVSGLILLMVAAFAGKPSARLVTILAVTALFGAGIFTAHLL